MTIFDVPTVLMELPGSDRSFSDYRSQLSNRLLDARTLVLNESLTAAVAGQLAEQLAVMEAESAEPIHFVMSNAPGGEIEAALSTYDLLRSLTAPVTMLGGGRIAGAGVIVFVGAPAERRYALPHVHFQLEEPQATVDSGSATDLEAAADAAADRRERILRLLAGATGHSEERIEEDVSAQRGFDGEEAVEYGLIQRVVQSRREIS
jgi:ATP-dependent Clp protease protease subunit